jgi:cytochrome P450 / NADPH-cytochrome P450 reductase
MRFEERDFLAEQGLEFAPAYLFFGCRHPDHDFLYRKCLEQCDKDGIISFSVVFLWHDFTSCRYVLRKL